MSDTDTRTNCILDWLIHDLNLQIKSFQPASSDASFRRYFRVIHKQGQHIVMDAPPHQENIAPFIRIAGLFKNAGLNVPDIIHQDLQQGFLLIEDFGTLCYLDQLQATNADTLYASAFDSLYCLQTDKKLLDCGLPYYDKALLNKELEIFYQWFVCQHLKQRIPDTIKNALNQVLIKSALEQPQVCVHRDYHSRNLMIPALNPPGIIDFQDAVIGPISYDPVSLLRDCYIKWPEHKVKQWLTGYFQKISERGLIEADLETFSRWFDLMGLQRHLKAIGIFCRLNSRDHKPDYLAEIPRTLSYVTQVCHKYPELAQFNHFLENSLLPHYQ